MKFQSSVFVLLATALVAEGVKTRRRVQDADEVMGASPQARKLRVMAPDAPRPIQTFFVPMPEEEMFSKGFYQINYRYARPPIESLISVAISTDLTQVWWDHWEDGYDDDVSQAISSTTQVWGDGDASNGCAPHVDPCTNSKDRLYAGDTVVIQNTVPLPRKKELIRYDGSDRIQASFPVAVTRGAYPTKPGSLMAGAVEVHPTNNWGLKFEAPIGYDVGRVQPAFEYSAMFFMAAEDNTVVSTASGAKMVLKMGEAGMLYVKIATEITSSKPIQVDFITGDRGSRYELRWYSLLSVEKYSSSYVSPVGDSYGRTKVLLYNPGPRKSVRVLVIYGYTDARRQWRLRGYYKDVKAKQYMLTEVIPTGSGAHLEAKKYDNERSGTNPGTFLALSLTDAEQYSGVSYNRRTSGQFYDWGFPLVPRNQLTSQVLIGLGFACTNNDCQGNADRSVVWITPVADCTIFIDYANAGRPAKTISAKQLQSLKIVDPKDNDMSGAIIYATTYDSRTRKTKPVDLAAAWGQDPSVSYASQKLSLDLGTTVLPFTGVKVSKLVNKLKVGAGEELTYTIRVSNVGQHALNKNVLTIKDVLDSDVTYVPNSASYSGIGKGAIKDSLSGSKFPLDGAGYKIPVVMPRRGGTFNVQFKVIVSASTKKSAIINKGTLTETDGKEQTFEVTSNIVHKANIDVQNTVALGHDVKLCGTPAAKDIQEGVKGSKVTYCFKVTNTGNTHLKPLRIGNKDLDHANSKDALIAPGKTYTFHLFKDIQETKLNTVYAAGTPVHHDGKRISGLQDVTDKDPSQVKLISYKALVAVTNTVYGGNDGGKKCGTAAAGELVKDISGTDVTYCFTLTNTGTSHLGSFRIINSELRYSKLDNRVLAPGASFTLSVPSKITKDLKNTIKVAANPVFSTGKDIPGMRWVLADDPSGVAMLKFDANVLIENKVYIGKDGGKQCGTPNAVEDVSDYYGTDVTYCFKVINNGDTNLANVAVVDDLLAFKDNSIGNLAPGKYSMLSFEGKIAGPLKNFATVTGNPVMADGRDIPNLKDVTHTDPSAVAKKSHEPSISLDNTVYLGTDGGKSCGTQAAKEFVKDFVGKPVTYCFTVKNTGDSYLDNVVISNEALKYKVSVDRIAPGVSRTIPYEAKIPGDLGNVAKVNANPTLEDGSDIPGHKNVNDSDPSKVGKIPFKAGITIDNKVYLGDDKGENCDDKEIPTEMVKDFYGAEVVYCLKLINTGNTYLKNIRLRDVELDYKSDQAVKMLAPEEVAFVAVPGKIVKDLVNNADVVATPSTKDGAGLGIDDVKHADPSEVRRAAFKPSVSIKNTVYKGYKGKSGCANSSEKVTDIFFTSVTYCFLVTNTGDTILDDVVVTNDVLKYTQELKYALKPGASILLAVKGRIRKDVENVAHVAGNPVLESGADIEGVDDVEDCDPSEVAKLKMNASVDLKNTVYLGHDDGGKCGTDAAVEYVKDFYGSNATYCFEITNTGETNLNKISLQNKELFFYDKPSKKLAPGESLMLNFASTITVDLLNNANVTANPIMKDGRDIADLPIVEASDPSKVGMLKFSPSIKIDNTAYLGDDDGAKCDTDGKEVVKDTYGSPVVYCLTVTNTGDTSLDAVTIVDEKIKYEKEIDPLKPGESTTVAVPRKIKEDLENTAVVTANPTMEDGSDIPHLEEVEHKDPSEVKVISHEASINIENTVYPGHDDGAKCGTDEATEKVTDYPGTDVTYCFVVKNTGDSYLDSVKITNDKLDFSDSTSIGMLAPSESKTISLPGTIDGNLANIAYVVANPVLQSGGDIPDAADVKDDDDSGVEEKPYSPDVSIDNTVYLGQDDGAKCGKDDRDFAEGIYGTEVTYCFVVTNNGDTTLSDVRVVNKELKYDEPMSPLKPGESKTVSVDGTIVSNQQNDAVVTANPVTADLEDIDGLEDVSDDDDSKVGKFDHVGGVKITNTVYEGDDDGEKCGTDAAVESVTGMYLTKTVYCFTVINTGDTFLDDILISNPELEDFKKSGFKPLPPGESITISYSSSIVKDLKNIATVTANPVTSTGQDIPDLTDVEASDPSNVVRLELSASVLIENTAYLGQDGGDSCGTADAVEEVTGLYGSNVTFCLMVTNNGETYLDKLVVTDKALSFEDNSIQPLKPGASTLLVVPGMIAEDGKNDAIVVGNPCLKDGTNIPDLKDVTSTDPSAVRRLAFSASVDIDNKVYLGSDNGASCDDAVNYVENYKGAGVTYCFEVTNTGDSYLGDVKINNEKLIFKDDSVDVLAPGESVVVAYTTTIDGKLENNAVVTANPTLENGDDIPDVADVTDEDTSAVGQLEYAPNVSIENTVYVGTDLGAQCSTAVEKVTDHKFTSVVFCFTVKNTGDTHLNNIVISDPLLGFDDNSIPQLAPGASTTVAFPSEIQGNVTNIATVVANPVLESGADISGAADVKDEDPSEVAYIVKDGDVQDGGKDPTDEPQPCMQNVWDAAGKDGELVCATKDVFVKSAKATDSMSCKVGEKITVSIDASISLKTGKYDLGWYVAKDGGDAMDGTCVTSGFKKGNPYPFAGGEGKVAWADDAADGDECGDALVRSDGAVIESSFLVETELPCTDENEDGVLDFAVCFTWRNGATNDVCTFAKNLPAEMTGGCFCTRVDIPNIDVETPVNDDVVAPC